MNGESSYRRFLQGDSDALGVLVETYNKSLVFYLNGILGNISAAEDAAADAFVRILVKSPTLRTTGRFALICSAQAETAPLICFARKAGVVKPLQTA